MQQPTYLVTGGAGDIGAWVVQALVEDGANVHVLARPSDRLEALRHLPITIHEGDATDETTVQAAVKEAAGDGLEGVVHAVGSIALRPPHALKAEAFREVIDTNLVSAFLLLSAAGKAMLRQGHGRMVFISSVAGRLGLVNHEAVAAAKGGLESMVRAAAATYAQRGLTVNAVAPALTETHMARQALSDAAREMSASMNPRRRNGSIEDVGQVIRWLLRDAPEHITGEIIGVDGGMGRIRS